MYLEIEGEEYKLEETSREKALEIEEGYTVNQQYFGLINKPETFHLIELETLWLHDYKADILRKNLEKTSVEVGGLILSPYFYELELTPKPMHPRLIGEEENLNLHRFTFELEVI